MSKGKKASSQDSQDFTAKEQEKEARAKIKQAEKTKSKDAKEKKSAAASLSKGGKKFAKFWKDFRGELRKIVWPDFKTVMRNTGIVLVTVLIVGAMIWIVDFGLTQGVLGLKTLAQGTTVGTTVPASSEAAPESVPSTQAASSTTEAPTTTQVTAAAE
ncbi:MAG: preprotein translocase subunit SecE [Oscillospiraceae bacterium]|jgi:preprotein translocase subunit SecE|nr:preprotein translocase subunit SecE [Oscillospiraceae bacterium]